MRSILSILLLFFFCQFVSIRKDPYELKFGKYLYRTGYTYIDIDVEKKGSFHTLDHSCTYDTEYKGKWTRKGDTLIAIPDFRNTVRDEKKKNWKPVADEKLLYLIRADMLITMDSTIGDSLARFDTLIWYKKVKPL